MKTKLYLLIICCVYQFSWSQNGNTKSLRGQVVTDSIQIDFGYVINLNTKIKTVIESKGFFEISAQENDTLMFLGLTFKSEKRVLTTKDFSVPVLKIKLIAVINKLDEVNVANNKIKPNIATSQEIVDQQYFDDEKSSPKNPIIQPSGTFENNADFVRMYKDLKKLLKKKDPENDALESQYTFIEIVLNTYNQSFFTDTLKLDESDVALFLIYCDNDVNSQKFLKAHTKFELTNFLVSKDIEFKRFTNFEK